MTDPDVIVIGAGAAGLLAAARAAERGRRVVLLEKNRKPGVKILMSGGTRCNLTHATDARGIVQAFGPPGRFLHSALAALGPSELVQLVEAEGVATKVEATGKVFPASDTAVDILRAFTARLARSGAELALAEPVAALERAEGGFVVRTALRTLHAPRVIVTTGGQSYPGCGTRGDAYAWLAELGHAIVRPRPALTPVLIETPWVRELKGVTVPDVGLRLVERIAPTDAKPRPLDTRRGSFLFTHIGLSGPVVLDISGAVTAHPHPRTLDLECDFLPAIGEPALEALLGETSGGAGRRSAVALLADHLPRRLIDALARVAQVDAETRLAELRRDDRRQLVAHLKRIRLSVAGTLGFEKAEVTAGGVALSEVDSHSMQSRLTPGLFLAGEVLDLDGPIGGYNFQAAFSTGWLAAESLD